MEKNDKFTIIHSEGNPMSLKKTIFADKRTGVNYIFVQSGYVGGLTPLLNGDGTPVITDFSKDDC